MTAFSFEKPAKWNAISADNDSTATLNTLPDNIDPEIDSLTEDVFKSQRVFQG